jgi:hypothetical protein
MRTVGPPRLISPPSQILVSRTARTANFGDCLVDVAVDLLV